MRTPIRPPFWWSAAASAGLSTALALSRKGIPVQVLEQAPEFKEIGAGIQLGPNVFRMFEVLGLTEQMFHWCAFPEGLEFRDSITGETIVDMKIDKRFHDKYRAPYGVIHRADMLNVILDACKKSNLIKLAISQKVVAIDDTGSGVTVKTETGETYQGAALVGCDGLWSTVREKIVGDGKPVVSGHIAYRAVLPTSEWPAEYRLPKMIVWCGEKTHLVHYPLRRGELFNLVVVFHSDRYEEGWDTYGDPEPSCTRASRTSASRCARCCKRSTPGRCGCCATARRSRTGPRAASRCSATPRIRCFSISRRAATWRWRTRSASPTRSRRRPATTRRRSRNTRSCAICAPRACN